jgi:hypothetical protein
LLIENKSNMCTPLLGMPIFERVFRDQLNK